MREVLHIIYYDETFIKVKCDPGTAYELRDFFTFWVPGANFSPKYQLGIWDGHIKLFNIMTQLLYAGLASHVEAFAKARDYEVVKEYRRNNLYSRYIDKFVTAAHAPGVLPFEPRYYQIDAFKYCVNRERGLLVCPTASGKSLISYMLCQFYKKFSGDKKMLIIVPTTNLVEQLASDFTDYGGNPDDVHKIRGGAKKDTDRPIVISTWQSIFKMSKQWLSQFFMVIGDEAHLFTANSLKGVLEKMTSTRYRFAMTGTLDEMKTHKLVLEGLFGPVYNVVSTKKLMKEKILADISINCITLNYSDEERQLNTYSKYPQEVDFIVRHKKRLDYIAKLAASLEGNTLVLFQYVEKHGIPLYDRIKELSDKPVHYIAGSVSAEDRERIRKEVDSSTGSITVASFGTFSTGVNIQNLNNIIFASPSKSRIRVMQSIGRGLRRSLTKFFITLYDIADDLSWKKRQNYTIKHFTKRVEMYISEGFKYKIYNVRFQ